MPEIRHNRRHRRPNDEQFPFRLHTMPGWISPFVDDPTGVAEGRLLAQVRAQPMAEVGAGVGGVMSYGYRMCLTRAADRVPFERPADYDEEYGGSATSLPRTQRCRRTSGRRCSGGACPPTSSPTPDTCRTSCMCAFSSVRMEVQYEMLGQVAGMAAGQAAASGQAVQRIDIRSLQGNLVDAGQVLAL